MNIKFLKKINIRKLFINNIGTKLIALILTIVLWFIINASRNVEIVKKIPLNFITSSELVVSNQSEDNKFVEIRLTGPRAFLREVMEKDIIINIDLRGQKPGFVRYKIYNDVIKLPIGVKITSIYPNEITPKLEYLKTKKVKVLPSPVGNISGDFKLEEIIIEPKEISISGPESKIESIKEIYTEPFDINNLSESITKEIKIDKERYKSKITHFSNENFSLYINVNPIMIKKKFYDIKVEAFSPSKFKINPNKIDVFLEGPKSVIDKLSKENIKASLDLTFNKPGNSMEEISVKVPNSRIKVISTNPKKVSVWIY